MKKLNSGTPGKQDFYTREMFKQDIISVMDEDKEILVYLPNDKALHLYAGYSDAFDYDVYDSSDLSPSMDLDLEELIDVEALDGGTVDVEGRSEQDYEDIIEYLFDGAAYTPSKLMDIEELAESIITGKIDHTNSGDTLYLKDTPESRELLKDYENPNAIESHPAVMLGEDVQVLLIPEAYNSRMYRKIADSYDVSNEVSGIPSVIEVPSQEDEFDTSLGQRI